MSYILRAHTDYISTLEKYKSAILAAEDISSRIDKLWNTYYEYVEKKSNERLDWFERCLLYNINEEEVVVALEHMGNVFDEKVLKFFAVPVSFILNPKRWIKKKLGEYISIISLYTKDYATEIDDLTYEIYCEIKRLENEENNSVNCHCN